MALCRVSARDHPMQAEIRKQERSMKPTAVFVSALSLLVAGTLVEESVAALQPPVLTYTGQVASTVSGCPTIEWHLARHNNGDVTGIFYYSDMSGISTATGTVDNAGNIQLTVNSRTGQGPVGTVTGMRSPNGAITAKLTGNACANAELHYDPVANWKMWNPPGQNPGWQNNFGAPPYTYSPPSQ
jgi:hypothetical protein